MTYESYISMSREALLAKMETVMPEKRLRHCLGVEKAARELAERFSLDVEKAGLAGLLHDYAKKVSDEDFLALIDKCQLDPDLKNWGNNIWHWHGGHLQDSGRFRHRRCRDSPSHRDSYSGE